MADAEMGNVDDKMAGIALTDGQSSHPNAGSNSAAASEPMAVEGSSSKLHDGKDSGAAASRREEGVKGVTSGEPVMRPTGSLDGHKESVTALHSGEDASRLISGSEDGTARVWDLERGRAIRCFTSPKDVAAQEVMSVAWGASDWKDLVAVGRGHSVALFDTREAAVVSSKAAITFAAHQDEVSEVTWDSENSLVAAADDAGAVIVYDIRAKKILRRMENCHSNICATVRFRPGHRWQLISAGLDGKLVHWSFNKVKALHTVALTAPQQQAQQLVNPRFVYAMANSGGPDDVVVGLGDGSVALVDIQRGAKAWEFEAFPNMLSALSFCPFAAPSHRYLLAAGSDAHVLLARVPAHPCLPGPFAQKVVAAVEQEAGVAVEEAGGCRRVLSLRCTSQVNAVASTAGGLVLVGDQGKSILTFNLASSV